VPSTCDISKKVGILIPAFINRHSITVEFVGVWWEHQSSDSCGSLLISRRRDTVASVGITPTPTSRHPYTSVDYATKFFRHALALDERRVRFQPQTWNTGTTDREQELDVDEPRFPSSKKSYDYVPPNRDVADVKEVWFAGKRNMYLRL
jgi:hypothetical protein